MYLDAQVDEIKDSPTSIPVLCSIYSDRSIVRAMCLTYTNDCQQ